MRADAALGRVIASKYRLDRLIGAGGMGRVYEAENTWTGLRVAIKLLHPEFALDEEYCERFKREARSAARIAHPNTVAVLDLGEAEDGGLFMVQELLVGRPLSDVIEQDGPIDVARVLTLFEAIADALSAAHEVGVFHRDVKPANVMISSDRRGVELPKVVDFGLAKLTAASTMTPSGVVLGSPAYLAPEQITHGHSTAKTDQWALGVCLFESLSGELPFNGETLPVIASQILAAEIPPLPPSVPPALDAVVRRAMTRDPDGRYPNMGALRDALGALEGSQPEPEPWDDPDTMRDDAEDSDSTIVDRGILERMKEWSEERHGAAVTTRRARGAFRSRLAIGHVAGVSGLGPRALATAMMESLPLDPRLLRYLTYADLVEAVGAGEVDVALLPPVAFAQARAAGHVRLLGVPVRDGRSIAAALLAPADQGNVLDGRDLHAVWVDPLSAAGCLVPRHLANAWAGRPLVYASQKHVGAHEAVVAAIHHGAATIGGCACVVDSAGRILDGPFVGISTVKVIVHGGALPEAAICASPALASSHVESIRKWLAGGDEVAPMLRTFGYDRIAEHQDALHAELARQLAPE